MLDVKKIGITAAAILVLSCLSLGGDGVDVELGANYWFSTLVWEWPNLDEMEEDVLPDKSPGKAIGLQFKVSQGKAGLFGRYYRGSDFDWEEETSFYDPYPEVHYSMTMGYYTDWTDFLIGVVYDITPMLGAFIGYKSTKSEMESKFIFTENIMGDIFSETFTEKGDIDGTGFGGGLTGDFWLMPDKLSIQYLGGYFPMGFDYTESVTYYFFEAGLVYHLNDSWGLMANYNYFRYDIELENLEAGEEDFAPDFILRGFSLGVVYNFNISGN